MILAIGLGILYGKKSILPLILPVSMALMTTFATQAWMGIEINLFSIMGTFLIIQMGWIMQFFIIMGTTIHRS